MAAFQTKIRKVRFQTVGYTGAQMAQAGQVLIRTVMIPRLEAAQTVEGTPAPPLKRFMRNNKIGKTSKLLHDSELIGIGLSFKKGYYEKKIRMGAKPIRDWKLTGHTHRAMKVLQAMPNKGIIGFTDAHSNKVAAVNNHRFRQFGAGAAGLRALTVEYQKFGSFVKLVEVP